MQDKKTHPGLNVLIAVVILIAVIGAGYFYATRDRAAEDLLLESSFDNGAVDGDLLSALGKLRTITLDEAIFQNPVFMSLSDFSTTIEPQPSGRQNPFAPLSSPAQSIPTGPVTVIQ